MQEEDAEAAEAQASRFVLCMSSSEQHEVLDCHMQPACLAWEKHAGPLTLCTAKHRRSRGSAGSPSSKCGDVLAVLGMLSTSLRCAAPHNLSSTCMHPSRISAAVLA